MNHFAAFTLPDLGEGLTDAVVLSWLVAPGDHVVIDQPVVEVETVKAVLQLPCPFEGIVAELIAPLGEPAPVGSPLLTVEVSKVFSPPAQSSVATEAATTDRPERPLVGYGAADRPRRRRRVDPTLLRPTLD